MSDSIKELQKTISSSLSIPSNHLTLGLTNLIHSNKSLLSLITHRRLPDHGWSDIQIQSLLYTFSTLDTNHESSLSSTTTSCNSKFHGRWVGVGEREGRVYSTIVLNRHYGLSHGIGRSGDVTEPQPKAVGSSIMSQLTTCLVLDLIRRGSGLKGDKNDGQHPAKFGLVLPMCTGMSMSLVLSSLRESTPLVSATSSAPQARDVVLWSRIDQKSCFKAIYNAGFKCIVVPTTRNNNATNDDSVITDIVKLQEYMIQYKDRLVAVISTTSCFAPRVPDKVDDIGKLCKDMNVPHIINNAYGLQCQKTCKLINRACVVGRVDAIVCSTDKNFLVPVGGAIVISPIESTIKKLGKIYAGRASSAPMTDLFITLLSLGLDGYKHLFEQRNMLIPKFQQRFAEIAQSQGERILNCSNNTISFGITLDTLATSVSNSSSNEDEEWDDKKKSEVTSLFGSMLFTRCVSGTRVVSRNQIKVMEGQKFIGFGSSNDDYPHSYLTAACAIGLTEDEMNEFFVRLEKCFKDFNNKRKRAMTKAK